MNFVGRWDFLIPDACQRSSRQTDQPFGPNFLVSEPKKFISKRLFMHQKWMPILTRQKHTLKYQTTQHFNSDNTSHAHKIFPRPCVGASLCLRFPHRLATDATVSLNEPCSFAGSCEVLCKESSTQICFCEKCVVEMMVEIALTGEKVNAQGFSALFRKQSAPILQAQRVRF